MSDDLDDFLRQAAERRKQRQRQKETRGSLADSAPAPPPASAPAPQSRKPISTFESQPLSQQQTVAESRQKQSEHVVVAEVVEPSRLKSQFDAPAKPIKQPKRQKQQPQSIKPQTSSLASTSAAPQASSSSAPINAPLNSSNILLSIRDPQSLKTAIIVHEILKRPWQD
ncbi:hypothetical protein SH449x_001392 [Pirellulaceae bacterium SH449]